MKIHNKTFSLLLVGVIKCIHCNVCTYILVMSLYREVNSDIIGHFEGKLTF